MDIYIKPKKKVSLSNREDILIGDVADIVATKDIVDKLKKKKLADIPQDKKKDNFLICVTDIIKLIKKSYPDYTVNNVGEMDTWVQHLAKKSPDRPWLKWLKIAFVVAVLFIGSSTAIMSFHTDAQIPTIFKNINYMLFNVKDDNPLLVHVPYSIGLALGVIMFFNHFAARKITQDPTPIEVEMSLYDTEVIVL